MRDGPGWTLPLGILAVIIAAVQYETWRIRRAQAVEARDPDADGASSVREDLRDRRSRRAARRRAAAALLSDEEHPPA
ncbi:hypothetical protein [Microbacterium lacticum]